ncbi:MAG: bifunctional 5,10-methylenetetrahydrofolate dehydrogenase/5,10-methenyltetrahydrofolate cyclohydrolase [Calditrichaceae bacterium]
MEKGKILDGKLVAQHVTERVHKQISYLKSHGVTPGLAVVIVGDDPASQVYVKRKGKASQQLGMQSETIFMKKNTSESELLSLIDELNKNNVYNGILVQMPLPDHISEEKVILRISPDKDVDCFHPRNVGLMVAGTPYVLPCTPAGIIEILQYYNIQSEGKHVVVIGRSNIVGKPMANLMMQKNKKGNATVTIVHSRTVGIEQYTHTADILIAAMGYPEFVKADMVKDGVIVIDVGMNRVDADNDRGYRLTGDVALEEVSKKASYITPVPGGVGPMTISMLMSNTTIAAAMQNGITLPE